MPAAEAALAPSVEAPVPPPLPRVAIRATLLAAFILPALLLMALVLMMIVFQYNILNWME